jgi:hypothetical protein
MKDLYSVTIQGSLFSRAPIKILAESHEEAVARAVDNLLADCYATSQTCENLRKSAKCMAIGDHGKASK